MHAPGKAKELLARAADKEVLRRERINEDEILFALGQLDFASRAGRENARLENHFFRVDLDVAKTEVGALHFFFAGEIIEQEIADHVGPDVQESRPGRVVDFRRAELPGAAVGLRLSPD